MLTPLTADSLNPSEDPPPRPAAQRGAFAAGSANAATLALLQAALGIGFTVLPSTCP